ncbi:hypothetical protein DdX_16812 [Ditylenchus destructor]|uniref:Saposin B-type domain-containing protein n=1 Tax=Ditylenchus destructor TaxID=166010 RepID=A0AAD4QWD7_9BILA|nr:hypothetical protein DdX_16812 [Ditylenchus destructor]
MNRSLFILVIGACLIHDIMAVPTSDVTGPKTEEKPEEDPQQLQKMNLCDQCKWAIFGLTFTLPNELNYERQYFYAMLTDQFKQICGIIPDFCALIDGKESEFVKEVLDCTKVEVQG